MRLLSVAMIPCIFGSTRHENKQLSEYSNHHHQREPSSRHLSSESFNSIASELSLPSLPSLNLTQDNFSTTSHQCIATLKAHSGYISSLAVDNNSLYSASADKDIRRWSMDKLFNSLDSSEVSICSASSVVAACPSAVKSLIIIRNKHLIITGHQDHKIRVWRINDCEKPGNGYKLRAVLPTVTSRCLSYFSADNYVEVRRHKKITWVHHADAISAIAVSNDKKFLYSVSWDRTIKIWRMSDFLCLTSVPAAHHDAINAIAVSQSDYIYTGSSDTTIKVWRQWISNSEIVTVSLITTLEKHKSAVNALALSADGEILYSGACDRSVVVWEKKNEDGYSSVPAGALRGHTKAILCLATVVDADEILCSGSADRTVRIWRRGRDRGHSCLAVLEGHRGPIKSLAIVVAAAVDGSSSNSSSTRGSSSSSASYFVYSGSMDCDIKTWRVCVPVCFR